MFHTTEEKKIQAYRENFIRFVDDYRDKYNYDSQDYDGRILIMEGLFSNWLYQLQQKILGGISNV